MARRVALVLVAALLDSVSGTAAVHADTRRWRDGNDARGPLDIALVSQGHRMGPKGVPQLVHTIRLHRAWPVKKLRHQGFVHVLFDRKGHPNGPEERNLWIVYRGGHLVATMYNSLGDPPKRLARVALWRPDWRTVKVAFPKTLLKRRGLERYKWSVLSFVEARHELCPRRDGCSDLAPNPANRRRYVKHVL
jgi:hypothetical protein